MTYEEVVNRIENIRRFGNLKGVEIMSQMLTALGNPQEGMRMIHIAGTNGKGSVSAFLCSILREAGLRVGVFTSPHLVDFRERVCINGEMIPEERVRILGESLLEQDFGVSPTMFDYCLAMALLYFKEEQCDVMILETGLGGKYDSTNAVGDPDVTVITKIGYDHMAILGDTLEEIASEKAGIIKKGTALIVESQEPEVRVVFDKKAEMMSVRAYRVVETKDFRECNYIDGEQQFSFGAYEELRMRMLGVHQYENAVAAIMAAEEFFEECNPEWIRTGIYRTFWRGRMEVIRKDPFLMIDGAHNSNGVQALKESLKQLFPGEQFHFVMGVMADKDYEQMIEELLPLALDFTTVTVEYERALQAEELADCITKKGVSAKCANSLEECLANDFAEDGNKTIAFGSLYFIGEIEAFFNEI